jgi:hypothetical protein
MKNNETLKIALENLGNAIKAAFNAPSVELAEEKFIEVTTVDGIMLEIDGDVLAVGATVKVKNADGTYADAPDGEHTLEDGTVIVTAGSAITEIKPAEVVEVEDKAEEKLSEDKPVELAKYAWDECMADQMARYNDEEIAAKVCGAIKAGGVEMRAFVDARAEIVDLQIEKNNLKKELDSVRAEFASFKNIQSQMFAVVNEIANIESEPVIEAKKNVFSKVEDKNEKIKNLANILSTLKK